MPNNVKDFGALAMGSPTIVCRFRRRLMTPSPTTEVEYCFRQARIAFHA